jgi:type VI secretion system protein ImpG
MHDELLDLYNQELTYLRRMGAEFARRYPGVASALQLDATRSADPHVERLLEGFAFLTARVQLRIRTTSRRSRQALLTSVYPEYTRPIPSMSLVQFQLDPEQGKLSTGFAVPADTPLYTRRAVNGVGASSAPASTPRCGRSRSVPPRSCRRSSSSRRCGAPTRWPRCACC